MLRCLGPFLDNAVSLRIPSGQRIEAHTDELAAPTYDALSADEPVAARADRRVGIRPSV